MIKFVLGLIALVFIGLALYVYTDKENKQPNEHATQPTEKTEITSVKEEVAVVKPKVVDQTTPAAKKVVKQESVEVVNVSHETVDTSNSEEIGKGLTLEGIENADVSDEEKERLRDDMAYYQSLHPEPFEPMSDEEIQKIIEEDLKNGLIQSN